MASDLFSFVCGCSKSSSQPLVGLLAPLPVFTHPGPIWLWTLLQVCRPHNVNLCILLLQTDFLKLLILFLLPNCF